MTALIKSKLIELPAGATYVRACKETTYGGRQPTGYSNSRKDDVFVGFTIKSMSTNGWGEKVREYEVYHLRQWDYPICKPIDSGGCYTGDISGFTTGIFPAQCHPHEAITVSEMYKRMGIEGVVTE